MVVGVSLKVVLLVVVMTMIVMTAILCLVAAITTKTTFNIVIHSLSNQSSPD